MTEPAAEREMWGLQASFKTFTQVTRNLEQAYRRLETRTAGIDHRLRDANQRLIEKVSELKSVSEELNGILAAIPNGVVTCDAAQVLQRVNPAAERILGRIESELCGRDARSLVDHHGKQILLLASDDVPFGTVIDRSVGCLDGSERCLSSCVAELRGGGRLEIITDQTEVTHLRTQINRLDTLAALGEMAASVAHEIRNPMSAVEGFAGLLERAMSTEAPPDGRELKRYTGRIRQGVVEVNGIITNLLLWARPDQGSAERFSVGLLVDELTSLPRLARSGDARIELELGSELRKIEIEGDKLRIRIALENLLRNASEAAGPQGRVRLEIEKRNRAIAFLVDDDGPGISHDVKMNLFRPFTTSKPNGNGLGLALAKKFIELHDGEIAARPSPLGGARFEVVLPTTCKEAT